MSPMFRSLANRNYRLFAGGQVVSLTGTWGQRVAQDWLVLNLSGNSGVALGFVTALQFLPVLMLSLWGGVLADRYDKRRMLIGIQSAMGLLALTLGLLDLTGTVALWHVYVLSFALGTVAAFDVPVRQSFVSELVGPAELPNAVSLNSATFNTARIAGPAVAGVMIAGIGTGWVFVANAASYLAVIAGLTLMRADLLWRTEPVRRGRGQVREGVAYVRSRPDLLVPIAMVAVIGTFGLNFQVTLALVAKQLFATGAGSFGLLISSLAVGSLIGALVSARRLGPPRQRTLMIAALAFGVLEIAVGLAPTFLVMALLLVPTGFAVLTFTTTANTLVQLGAEPYVRGRVMALYVLVFLGGTPVGAPVIGALAEAYGPRFGLLLGGLACVLAAVGGTLVLTRKGNLRLEPHLLRRRPYVSVHALGDAALVPGTMSAEIAEEATPATGPAEPRRVRAA